MSNTVIYVVAKQFESTKQSKPTPIMDRNVVRVFFTFSNALRYFSSLEVAYQDAEGTITPSLRTLQWIRPGCWHQVASGEKQVLVDDYNPDTWVHGDYAVVSDTDGNIAIVRKKDYDAASSKHDADAPILMMF